MAQGLVDRVLTIVVTATLTSAAWIVAGSVYFEPAGPGSEAAKVESLEGVSVQQQPENVTVRTLPASTPEAGDTSRLAIPVANIATAQLVDTFVDERGGGERLHEALDIMAPAGTAVVAAGPGTVEKLFRSEAGGNTIYVRSADRRTIHYYAHLQDYAPGLKEGQRVARGHRLGSVGSSGNASEEAPHLHFAILLTTPDAEWWEPAAAVNPYPLLRGT